jgi:hypothetical protein
VEPGASEDIQARLHQMNKNVDQRQQRLDDLEQETQTIRRQLRVEAELIQRRREKR